MVRKLLAMAVIAAMGLSVGGCLMGGGAGGDSIVREVASGAPQGTGFQVKTLKTASGHERKYSVFIPFAYNAQKKWPVIMFLHGMGEGGSDGTKCITVGLGEEVRKRASDFPFIVVFPQSGDGSWNENSRVAEDAMAALHEVEHDYSADTNCVALTGLSHGGYGTWAIGAKYSSDFTALIPMCSDADWKDVETLAKINGIWGFHFSGDPFVPAFNTSAMCDKINKLGGHAKCDIYAGLGHAVWHQAYGNDELYSWILSTRRTGGSAEAIDAAPAPIVAEAKHVSAPAKSAAARPASVNGPTGTNPPTASSVPMSIW